jgi:muramoyltetrapeptide carboxypeptidase
MGQVKLPTLLKGDKIRLIAPARAVTPEEMGPFVSWINNLGLNIEFGAHLYGRHHQFSGTDEERAQDFINSWINPEIKAVICARGGYGCMRFMHLIPDTVWEKGSGKILAGFSDITTLHLALNAKGIETLHSPMAINFLNSDDGDEENFSRFKNALFSGKIEIDLSKNAKLNNGGFEGELMGGNLSLLYASLGTPEQPATDGKILFFEDLDEYLYHIDRMMVSLKRAKIFSGIKALLVGGMDKMVDNTVAFGQQAQEIVIHHTQEYGFPIIFDFPSGHGVKNFSFKLGAFTTFDGSILSQL